MHIYSGYVGKAICFGKRFGLKELFLSTLRLIFADRIIAKLPRRSFQWDGVTIDYFYHRYNTTWANERAVEVPIAKRYLEGIEPANLLEVGNVMAHYGVLGHAIVDKYEPAAGIINEDIIDYAPGRKFELILSVSTFEHIGFDDDTSDRSGEKILKAIGRCRTLLGPKGRLVITVPLGYNPDLDLLVKSKKLGCARDRYLYRTGFTEWKECDQATALDHPYMSAFPYANSLLFAEFGPG
jgi:SAM-dependent methyltransferase